MSAADVLNYEDITAFRDSLIVTKILEEEYPNNQELIEKSHVMIMFIYTYFVSSLLDIPKKYIKKGKGSYEIKFKNIWKMYTSFVKNCFKGRIAEKEYDKKFLMNILLETPMFRESKKVNKKSVLNFEPL